VIYKGQLRYKTEEGRYKRIGCIVLTFIYNTNEKDTKGSKILL
jgi:hypothetical protein